MEEQKRVYFKHCDLRGGLSLLGVLVFLQGAIIVFSLDPGMRPLMLIMLPMLLMIIWAMLLLLASVELNEDGLHRCVAGFLHEYLRWDEIAVCGVKPGVRCILLFSTKPLSKYERISLFKNQAWISLRWMLIIDEQQKIAEKIALVEQLRIKSGGEFLTFDGRADRQTTMEKLQAKKVRPRKKQDQHMLPTLHRGLLVLIVTDVVALLFLLAGGFRQDAYFFTLAACFGVLLLMSGLTRSGLAAFVPLIAMFVCALGGLFSPWICVAFGCVCAVLLIPILRFHAWASRCYLLQENGIDVWFRQNRQTIPWDEIDSVDLVYVRSAFLELDKNVDPEGIGKIMLRCTTRAYTGKRTQRQKLSYYRTFPDDVFLIEANAESLRYFETNCPLPIRDCLQETTHW